MTVEYTMRSEHVSLVFPVTLSREARRAVLIRTGESPAPEQVLVVHRLKDLSLELRKRLIDVWDKVNVEFDAEKTQTFSGPELRNVRNARNLGYLWLQRAGRDDRWTRYLSDTEGDGIDLDHIFVGVDGRTVDVLRHFRATLDTSQHHALEAMLCGAPLVLDGRSESKLRTEDVLEGYERAIELAERLIAAVDSGTRAPIVHWMSGAHKITDDAIFVCPDYRAEGNRPAAILKAASPEGYARARELLEQITDVPVGIVAQKLDRVCFHWWSSNYAGLSDERKVEELLKPAVMNARSDAEAEKAEREAAKRYEKGRAEWIDKHGSQRLKRAAARDYRHDGIYRDERLEAELPGFVGSLGRKPTIRDLVNPSEAALDLEAETLARCEALGIDAEQVRLVFAQPGDEVAWVDGEFVQVEGYLGRHTVWRSVSGETEPGDLPF